MLLVHRYLILVDISLLQNLDTSRLTVRPNIYSRPLHSIITVRCIDRTISSSQLILESVLRTAAPKPTLIPSALTGFS